MKKEEDKLKIRSSRKAYIPVYFMMLVLALIIIYILNSGKPLNDLAFKLASVFAVVIFIATEIHRLGNSYEINNNSIIHRSGYLNITSKRLEFGAISDSDVQQSIWQRLFSYGNVEIHLFSKENKTIVKNINHPYRFVDFLQRTMGANSGRKR